ncbi:MAG: hypothetical protein EB127_25670, partial [Alphaproteobacteria bacterium]|nr:hypothetical protein [Alphaproteobacteria bacterium]
NLVIRSNPNLEAEWEFIGPSLNVRIVIFKEYLNACFEALTAEEFKKNFFHQNYGVIPHEILEANLTATIMQKRFDEVPEEYKVVLKAHWPEFERLFKRYTYDPNNLHLHENEYNVFGGTVHDVIEKSTPGYYEWGEYVWNKIKLILTRIK